MITLYHPNARGTGSMARFKFTELGTSITLSPQSADGFDEGIGAMAFLAFNDICKVLQVLRGEEESAIICHDSSTLRFRHVLEPMCGYDISIDDGKTCTCLRFMLSSSEALGMCVILEEAIKKIALLK